MAAVGRAGDRGAVTVEAALALCSLVAVLALALAGVSAVSTQLRCIDAAREAARLTARGEPEHGQQIAQQLAPGDATVRIAVRGEEVVVEVAADPVGGLLPGVDVRAEAVAMLWNPGWPREGTDGPVPG